MPSSCIRGVLDWILRKISLLKEWSDIGIGCPGGVTIPGGVQKTCRHGTSGHGLAGMVVTGWRLNLMILEVFSNLSDSVILWLQSIKVILTLRSLFCKRKGEKLMNENVEEGLAEGSNQILNNTILNKFTAFTNYRSMQCKDLEFGIAH